MKKLGILGLILLLPILSFIFPACGDGNRWNFPVDDDDELVNLPSPGGPVRRLTIYSLDTISGEHGAVEDFVENNGLRDGSETFPFLVGSIGRGFSANVSVEVFPRNAVNQEVHWIMHNSTIADINIDQMTQSEVTVRGITNGFALFHVESVENPDILVYFHVRVTDPVLPTGFVNPVFEEFPIWDDNMLNDPGGLSFFDYKTLGLGSISNTDMSTGIFRVRIVSSSPTGEAPSNLNLIPRITPEQFRSAFEIEQVSSNRITGDIELQITALAGTRGEAARIELNSAASEFTSLPIYIRVIQPFPANSVLSILPALSPSSVNPLEVLSGVPRDIVVSAGGNFPPSDARYQWRISGSQTGYTASLINDGTNRASLTLIGDSGLYPEGVLEIEVTARDYYDNERTASITRFEVR